MTGSIISCENDLVCAEALLVIIVGDMAGEGGRRIFEGDLNGEGMFNDRSVRGCLFFEGDAIDSAVVRVSSDLVNSSSNQGWHVQVAKT